MQTSLTDSSGDEAAAVDVHQLEDLLRAEASDHAGVVLVVGPPPALGQAPHNLLARLINRGFGFFVTPTVNILMSMSTSS